MVNVEFVLIAPWWRRILHRIVFKSSSINSSIMAQLLQRKWDILV